MAYEKSKSFMTSHSVHKDLLITIILNDFRSAQPLRSLKDKELFAESQ
jgi:hypothetical protein